jgi:predicted  nucleic acid-binding Zn-ribbon protein
MTQSFYTELKMATEICSACGVQFALPEQFMGMLRENGHAFSCPNGHTQHYTKTIGEELQTAENKLESVQREKDQLQKKYDRLVKKATKEATKEAATKVVYSSILDGMHGE